MVISHLLTGMHVDAPNSLSRDLMCAIDWEMDLFDNANM